MVTQTSSLSWEEALKGFFLHKRAVREFKTAKWYRAYVNQLMLWAQPQDISLESFTKLLKY